MESKKKKNERKDNTHKIIMITISFVHVLDLTFVLFLDAHKILEAVVEVI